MSIPDFVTEIGQKLFSGKDDPAAAIRRAIEADNARIENLGARYVDAFIASIGTANAGDSGENAIRIAGNVGELGRAVSDIELFEAAAGAVPSAAGVFECDTVKIADTLSSFARHLNGAAQITHGSLTRIAKSSSTPAR